MYIRNFLNLTNITIELHIISHHKGMVRALDLEPLLVAAGWLVLLLVVDMESEGSVGVSAEPLLQHLPDPHDGLDVGSISEPDCDLVSSLTDIDHGTIHLRRLS